MFEVESLGSMFKSALGWGLLLFGLMSFLFICIEWSCGTHLLIPNRTSNAVLITILIYCITPLCMGSILHVKFKKVEVYL